MDNLALLIIDVQQGNFSEQNPIYKGAELLKKIKNLISKARIAKIPIIYVQHCGSKNDIDEPGTPGWDIHSMITPKKEDIIIQKKTPDSFLETRLKQELDAKKANHLIITGLQTEFCIDTTCRRAFSLGYKVTLVKDSHSTWDSQNLTAEDIIEHHNDVLGGWFVDLKEERDIEF